MNANICSNTVVENNIFAPYIPMAKARGLYGAFGKIALFHCFASRLKLLFLITAVAVRPAGGNRVLSHKI